MPIHAAPLSKANAHAAKALTPKRMTLYKIMPFDIKIFFFPCIRINIKQAKTAPIAMAAKSKKPPQNSTQEKVIPVIHIFLVNDLLISQTSFHAILFQRNILFLQTF